MIPSETTRFEAQAALHQLKHYLPAQAPLKDFIHHNTLHAFQHLRFFDALHNASEIFGYKVSLSLEEYRAFYQSGRIREDVLTKVISDRKGSIHVSEWKEKLLVLDFSKYPRPRIGSLRAGWKKLYHMDMDSVVHPLLFRILCSYLDQGISIWNFPVKDKTFLTAIREMERNSYTSYFRSGRAKSLLLKSSCEIADLLAIVVGEEALYQQYLFDQQFSHQGWSGMVSAIENEPHTLLDTRKISLHDLVVFELLLEIDALDSAFGKGWPPLADRLKKKPKELFAPVKESEVSEVFILWQLAFEWSYYDEVLAGLQCGKGEEKVIASRSFQALFCIDDRECSLRRYLEKLDPNCETLGTPGFFGVEFFFQPEHGKFYTKLCPAPVTPKHLIKELDGQGRHEKDIHFSKHAHSFHGGWLIAQTLGFWAAIKLFINIFKPSMSPATASSFKHMDKFSTLTIENKDSDNIENNLQIGFTIAEMAIRVENLLKSIGMVADFAPIVYVIGHGSSSVNNPHFAAYDCGACSGRAGSVNSRTICFMANHPKVREILRSKGVSIPFDTQFIGGLHDTTRDEIIFFDEDALSPQNQERHTRNERVFSNALVHNSKERSRRFVSINTHQKPERIHEEVKIRSVSLFEPRPELNHATNALCIVGRRSATQNLFLDRRAFMNSYNYATDLEGKYLVNIMKPLGPVCGGINLEYFFSRVDNQKLGAGTKLPHNVMGLFGVANGIDGDLRPGLPSQMIEVHDPVRLMIIVEHFPEVVLKSIQTTSEMYEWFINEWVNLVSLHPETRELSLFSEGRFIPYKPLNTGIAKAQNLTQILEEETGNLPVYRLA